MPQVEKPITHRHLPIGISDFRRLRETDCHYVDKTPFIRELVERGDYYFLSRPRRFGKSLLLDTLGSLFACHEPLFRGLHIHPHWDWSSPYPVVRLGFYGKYNGPKDIERDIQTQLEAIERDAGLPPASGKRGQERLLGLLDRLHRAAGQRVVVLVDDYDKPILDTLHDPELATASRDHLYGLYGIIKGSAGHVRFNFVTGVSALSMANMFSGLNNLLDISLDPRHAAVCGYTEDDLDRVFGPELAGLDRDRIRNRYKGYHWRGGERIYNPHDILQLLRNREFRPYWFKAESRELLYRTLMKRSISPMELENLMVDMSRVSRFDVEDIDIKALLFQTGYLTIAEERREDFDIFFMLNYPNPEIRTGLNRELLAWLGNEGAKPPKRGREFCALLEANDFAGFGETLRAWLSGIPYQWDARDDLARYGAWYAGLLHMCLRLTDMDPKLEKSSYRGRTGMILPLGGQVFVLEFRGVDDGGDSQAALDAAVTRMRARDYVERYSGHDGPVHLVGVACGREVRNLLEIRVEPA